jgi:hypothetical protein
MDFGLGFLGEYITAAELVDKTPTLTIGKVTLEKVESLKHDDGAGVGKLKDKIIIYFSESKSGRGWLLNRTNALCLVELWGRETEKWLGHKITLFVCPVRVGPKMDIGIRIKGSPELTAPRQFELKLPRKKPILTTLVPTGKIEQVNRETGEVLSSKPEQKAKPKQDNVATLADAIALLDKGDRDTALSLRASLSEDDRARFDIEWSAGETVG